MYVHVRKCTYMYIIYKIVYVYKFLTPKYSSFASKATRTSLCIHKRSNSARQGLTLSNCLFLDGFESSAFRAFQPYIHVWGNSGFLIGHEPVVIDRTVGSPLHL